MKKTILVIAIVIFSYTNVCATDTTEPFDVGATDFEFYFEYGGLGSDAKGVATETVLGYGLTESISGSVAFSSEADDKFANGASGRSFGLFSTIVDGHHMDFDIFFNISSDFEFAPGFELNYDLKPDLEFAGFYLVVEGIMSGVVDTPGTTTPTVTPTTYKSNLDTAVTLGGYYTLDDKTQFHITFDFTALGNAPDGADSTEIGGIGLGYNRMLNDSIELISQFVYDIPGDDEDASYAISAGIVVTMPKVENSSEGSHHD